MEVHFETVSTKEIVPFVGTIDSMFFVLFKTQTLFHGRYFYGSEIPLTSIVLGWR